MDGVFDGLTLDDFNDDIYRNIASLRGSQDLYDDLSDSPESWQAATDLEMTSKPYTYDSAHPIIDRPFEEAAFNEAISYPFENWSKTRYSDGSFGVWYGADSLKTSIYETVYHWRSVLLEDAGWGDLNGVVGERKVYIVRCNAALLDFVPKLKKHPALIDPAPGGNFLTHQVGARIHHDGHPGLISRSARYEDGLIYAIFKSQVLSDPRQFCYLTYRVQDGSVAIERQPGEQLMRI